MLQKQTLPNRVLKNPSEPHFASYYLTTIFLKFSKTTVYLSNSYKRSTWKLLIDAIPAIATSNLVGLTYPELKQQVTPFQESVHLHLLKGQSDDELPTPSQSLEDCSDDNVLHVPAVLPFLPWSPLCHWSHCLEVWKITGIQFYYAMLCPLMLGRGTCIFL